GTHDLWAFFLASFLLWITPGPGGTLWSALFALGAATASAALRRSPRLLVWLERLSGCVYIALGLNLLRSRPQPA
ncbi:MAG TPA: hypothetical protein VIX40_10255, partial [Methylomirabilota bacterium]